MERFIFSCLFMKRKLITAVRNNDTAQVAELLLQGVTPNCRDHSTPLQLAVRQGNAEMTKMLLSHGANPNTRSIMGHTALEFAMTSNHAELLMLELVSLLLAHGADPARDASFSSHVDLAKRTGSAELFKMLSLSV